MMREYLQDRESSVPPTERVDEGERQAYLDNNRLSQNLTLSKSGHSQSRSKNNASGSINEDFRS